MIAESSSLEDLETGKKEKHVCYFKAKVLDVHDGEEIDETIKKYMTIKVSYIQIKVLLL